MEFIRYIIDLDLESFIFLNSLHHPILDKVMYFLTNKWVWLPFYGLLIFYISKIFNTRQLVIIIISISLIILICDQISVHLFKNVFERLRPCHNSEIMDLVHTVKNKCGGLYSFISSHAANSFGVATFTIILFRKKYKPIIYITFAWAILFSYTRIYLGLHYPADIIGGWLLGIGVSALISVIFLKISLFKGIIS